MMSRRKIESEFQRRRRNFIIEQVRDAFPGICVAEGHAWRVGGDRWEFHYRTFLWCGQAAGANDATAKGWITFLRQQGVAGYARHVQAPRRFAGNDSPRLPRESLLVQTPSR